MVIAGINVIELARTRGRSRNRMPYINQSSRPAVTTKYITNEILFVSRVRITLMACGKKAKVVSDAATKPMILIKSIYFFRLFVLRHSMASKKASNKSVETMNPLDWFGPHIKTFAHYYCNSVLVFNSF